jgi:hypothetical protein
MNFVATPLAAPVRSVPMPNTCTIAHSSPVSSRKSENMRPALRPNTAVLETLTP